MLSSNNTAAFSTSAMLGARRRENAVLVEGGKPAHSELQAQWMSRKYSPKSSINGPVSFPCQWLPC